MVVGTDCHADDQWILTDTFHTRRKLLRDRVPVVDDSVRDLLGGGAN